MNSKAGSSNRRLQILLEEHGIPVPQNTYLRKVYVRFIENGDHVAQFSGYRNPQERAVVIRRMCEEYLKKEIIIVITDGSPGLGKKEIPATIIGFYPKNKNLLNQKKAEEGSDHMPDPKDLFNALVLLEGSNAKTVVVSFSRFVLKA